jgi:hypothetical protein
VSEWLKELVSKTSVRIFRTAGSNPALSGKGGENTDDANHHRAGLTRRKRGAKRIPPSPVCRTGFLQAPVLEGLVMFS